MKPTVTFSQKPSECCQLLSLQTSNFSMQKNTSSNFEEPFSVGIREGQTLFFANLKCTLVQFLRESSEQNIVVVNQLKSLPFAQQDNKCIIFQRLVTFLCYVKNCIHSTSQLHFEFSHQFGDDDNFHCEVFLHEFSLILYY